MHATDARYLAVLGEAGFDRVRVETIRFTLVLGSADAWWAGVLAATVRTAASIEALPAGVCAQVRATFDRLALEYGGQGGLAVPVSVKLIAGRSP